MTEPAGGLTARRLGRFDTLRPGRAASRPATRAIRGLTAGLIVLQVAIAGVNLSPLVDRFAVGELLDVNREASAVVWFTSALLWTIALLAAYAAATGRSAGSPRSIWVGWTIVAAGFTLLSIDETAQLHERVGEKVSDFWQLPFLPGLYSWVIVVAPLALAGALWMIRWFGNTIGFRSPTTRLVIAAVGLWVLVPGFEMLDPSLGSPDLLIVIEETCETMGATLFLTGVLLHFRDRGWLRLPADEDHGTKP